MIRLTRFLPLLVLFFLIASASMVPQAEAQTVLDNIQTNLFPTSSVYNQPNLLNEDTRAALVYRVALIIGVFLGLLGLIMVILILYGGYLWMTARGNEQQVEDAKHTIRSAIIGAIIIISSYALTSFILNAVLRAVEA